MSTETGKPAVRAVLRGEVVEFGGAKYWVISACDTMNVAYYCVSCEQQCANRFNLGEHCKQAPMSGDAHVVVRCCAQHGLEAPTIPKPDESESP